MNDLGFDIDETDLDAQSRGVGVDKGAANPKRETVARVSRDQVREIAEAKMPDLNAIDLDGAMAQVAGTARSMGIEVGD